MQALARIPCQSPPPLLRCLVLDFERTNARMPDTLSQPRGHDASAVTASGKLCPLTNCGAPHEPRHHPPHPLERPRPLHQSARPDGVAGQSLPRLKVHTKAIQALSRADGRWYFLPVVELPVILTPGEDGYIVAECPRRPDFSVFPITW